MTLQILKWPQNFLHGQENDPYFFGVIQKFGVFETLSSVLLLQEAKKLRAIFYSVPFVEKGANILPSALICPGNSLLL